MFSQDYDALKRSVGIREAESHSGSRRTETHAILSSDKAAR